jgi:Fe-S-cluster containining protein
LTDESVAAGPFGAWLARARAALRGEAGNDVPCGDCVGCCTSSYYIPLRPRDVAVLEQVPAAFLTKSQDQPDSHWLMGYRPNGHCPMFAGQGCSVYATRPQTCRDYDCRVFAAAGIDAGGADKDTINRRVRAWTFTYTDAAEREAHAAVRQAALFVQANRELFPAGFLPATPMGLAVLSIKVYGIFAAAGRARRSRTELARAVVETSRAFDNAG